MVYIIVECNKEKAPNYLYNFELKKPFENKPLLGGKLIAANNRTEKVVRSINKMKLECLK